MKLEKLRELRKEKGKAKDFDEWYEMWLEYFDSQTERLEEMEISKTVEYIMSEINHSERRNCHDASELGVNIRVGDICYIDYGDAYLNEVGYLHMGLILNIFNNKALVVPIIGNQKAFEKAMDENNENTEKTHLIKIPKLKGLNKNSIAIINDIKWINSARIIDVKAYLPIDSILFQFIRKKVKDII